MTKHLEISTAKEKAVLSKEQKRYNNLLKSIQQLRNNIELTKEMDLYLRKVGVERVMPAEHKCMKATRDFVVLMDKSPFASKLKKKQAERYGLIILQETDQLLNTDLYGDDAELKAIFGKHNQISWDDMKTEEETFAKQMAAQMANNMFGMSLEADDLDDPEKLAQKMNEKQAQIDAQMEAEREKKERRKKTERQINAENQRKAAEDAVNKTTKQIYHDLVKNFHPDKETDEQKRAEKTEIMKQITAAYDTDDRLKLLELQMTLLAGENVFSKFDERQLRYFNDLLKQQKYDLEMELEMVSPKYNGNKYWSMFSLDRAMVDWKVKSHVKNQELAVKQYEHWIGLIKYEPGFKELVKHYEIEEDYDMDDVYDLMRMFK